MAGNPMTPWTPRESALRAALEGVKELAKEWVSCAMSDAHDMGGAKEHKAVVVAEEAFFDHINAALADPPPPDPRDAAPRCSVCNGTGIERSGVCHCGAEMDGHSVYDNHGALEMVRPCESCTAHLQAKLASVERTIKEATESFEAIQFECDGKSDVEDDDNGISNRPNLAMRIEMIADKALTAIRAAKGGA